MKKQIKIWHIKKKQEGWLYENDVSKKIIAHSKLKLWIFFWDQGEFELLLLIVHTMYTI